MATDMSKKILVWFRNDLRLHDNEMLVEAIAKADEILPVYVFDPRHFEHSRYHTIKTGSTRAQFLLESVAAIRQSFQKFGGDKGSELFFELSYGALGRIRSRFRFQASFYREEKHD